MTNEERDIITQFIGRVGGTQAPGQPSFGGGSVPATTAPSLPPIDPEADRLIAEQFARYPEARYRLTQPGVYSGACAGRGTELDQRLEWEQQQAQQALQQAQQQAQQAQQQAQQSSGSSGGSIRADCSAAAPDRLPRRSRARLDRCGIRARRRPTSSRPTSRRHPPPPQYRQLSAGHVSALGLRIPRLGVDDGGWRRRRSGRG